MKHDSDKCRATYEARKNGTPLPWKDRCHECDLRSFRENVANRRHYQYT